MTKELTAKEYKSTMTGEMVDITEAAEPVVDIWPYVQKLTIEKVVLYYVYEKELIETVYQNANGTFHHILLPTDNKNKFIVIIVDINAKDISGHFILDLKREYGML